MKHEKILVLDFGGQYNQLIARRVREFGVYSEVRPYTISLDEIRAEGYQGIIFTGGPGSVFDEEAPRCKAELLELGIPVLGICYGCQLMALLCGGMVNTAPASEYGKVSLRVNSDSRLFRDIPQESIVWMSHTDYVEKAPSGFEVVAQTDHCPCAAMQNTEKKLYAVQFHPEVTHTQFGNQLLKNFVFEVCSCKADWVIDDFIEKTISDLKEEIGDKQVILGLSGGVDSSVAAALLSRAIGKQLTCVFVDHGLMRKDEGDFVEETFTKMFDMNFVRVNCGELFIAKLKGVTDPEEKRKIISEEFYKVFWDVIRDSADGDAFFAQGTIYPDRIESGKGASGDKAGSAVIKTHHNMGKIPDDVEFLGVVEPLKELFKDEVRAVGEKLGIPHELVWRQPFPGPGLGVRIVGEITEEKVKLLQDADYILRDEMAKNGYERNLSQFFCVYTGSKAVGVMGDHRTYENVIAIRAVTTDDFMTADWAKIPYDILATISNRITNEVRGINRIVYDITSKPPATVEWE
ncbi:MAG: glutamine-hydrolyzing GMP synthase [Clostridiales bacterium]|nr:glutamine-hydrolyzing GMP synthase [Clostridiales bacterium]